MGSHRSLLEFGSFRLDRQNQTLSRAGVPIALRPKTYALLDHLVLNAGVLARKDDLLALIWPNVVVTDTVLKVCVRELREALADDPRRPRFIETRHRVGYIFIAPVIEAESSPQSMTSAPETPVEKERILVGRDRELGKLRRMHDTAMNAQSGPRVVFVSGEAGLGKSALVEAFMRDAKRRGTGALWCSGTCVEQHGGGEALFAFLEGLGALAAVEGEMREKLRTLAPTWCLELPEMFSRDERLAEDALGATRPRMMRELKAALGALPKGHGLVWILEDMHWADASSVDLLRYLGTTLRTERVLFVVTLRPIPDNTQPLVRCMLELATRRQSEVIALEPLTNEDVARYLDLTLGPKALDRSWRDLIAARTEGHPLFLSSLVQHLLATELDPKELLRSVPSNVDAMVERKLGGLDAESRRTLTFGAVQGVELYSDVLARTLKEDPAVVEERLDTIHRAHRLLLAPVEAPSERAPALQYRFAHALYRDALYRGITPSRRGALHREVALALEERSTKHEREAIAATLAHHFELGSDVERALEYLGVVVGTAERRLAFAEAESACAQAFKLIDLLPEGRRGGYALRFHKRRAGLRIAAARFAEATDDLAAARAFARAEGDVEAEIDSMMQTFRQAGYMGQFQQAGAIATEAATIADAHGLERLRWEIDASVAALRGVRGELEKAVEGLRAAFEGLACKGQKANLALRLDYCGYQCMRGHHEEATSMIDDVLAEAHTQGDALRVGAGLFWRAHGLANLGLFTEALWSLESALRLGERNDDAFYFPRLLTLTAWTRRQLGAFEESLDWSRRALDAKDNLMPDNRAHALLGIAATSVALERFDEADAAMGEVASLLERPFFSSWHVKVRLFDVRARHALARGDLDDARRFTSELSRWAEEHGLEKHGAAAQLLSASIELLRGDLPGCRKMLDVLDAQLAKASRVLLRWRCHALRARAAATEDERARALAAGVASVKAILTTTPVRLHDGFIAHAERAGLAGLATAIREGT